MGRFRYRPFHGRVHPSRQARQVTGACVYCGSSLGSDPAFVAAARHFGKLLAENGIGLVYGGGSTGMMGALAVSVYEHGGEVIGVIPDFLRQQERVFDLANEIVVTRDMHERKRIMFERADAFVALAGGVGTLEELVEQMTWAQLGRHQKPVLLANIEGFWNPLIRLLDAMRKEQFIRSDLEVACLVADRAEDIVPRLQEAVAATPESEFDKSAAAEPLSRM